MTSWLILLVAYWYSVPTRRDKNEEYEPEGLYWQGCKLDILSRYSLRLTYLM